MRRWDGGCICRCFVKVEWLFFPELDGQALGEERDAVPPGLPKGFMTRRRLSRHEFCNFHSWTDYRHVSAEVWFPTTNQIWMGQILDRLYSRKILDLKWPQDDSAATFKWLVRFCAANARSAVILPELKEAELVEAPSCPENVFNRALEKNSSRLNVKRLLS